MATLEEDIHTQFDWLVTAFASDQIELDYSIQSLRKIDRFFEQHAENGKAKPNGRLSTNSGPVLFSIGAYVGNTIIKAIPGSVWVTDDKDPKGEITAEVLLPNKTKIFPMQRAINRFMNGEEDSIYPYGTVLVNEISKDDYWENAKENHSTIKVSVKKTSWWKFW
jgi:hypothetical protein